MKPDPCNDDLALLEAHLDGALLPAETETLGRRLAAEPALAWALERLRAERAVRGAVWASFEPDADQALATAAVAVAAAARAQRWRNFVVLARRASAVAAVVLLAFAGGWAARGRSWASPRVAEPTVHTSASSSFPVALTDENGNIIAVQHFKDQRRAREFAEDVGRWQSRTRHAADASPPSELLTPVSDEF